MGNLEYRQNDSNAWKYENTFLIAEDDKGGTAGIHEFYRHRDMEKGVKNMKLTLIPGSQISGRAVDDQGQPVEGASVGVVLCDDHFEPLYVYKNTITDGKGGFKLSELLMQKHYLVILTTSDGAICIKYYNSGDRGCNFNNVECFSEGKAGMVDMGDFLLSTNTYSVSGYVVDIFGRPISGGSVILESPGQGIIRCRTSTDEDGRFIFDDLFRSEIVISAGFGHGRSYPFNPSVGMNDIRMILPYDIPEPNLADEPIASAAVELTVVDNDTGELITLPKAYIYVRRENGNNFGIDINNEGKCFFLLGGGKYGFSLLDTDGKYRYRKMKFTAELYEHYILEFQAVAKLTTRLKQKGFSYSSSVIYPEVRSKTEPNIWNTKTSTRSSDSYKVLEIFVYDEETDMPIADGQVLISFHKGNGRFIGKTNENGTVAFAVFSGMHEGVLTSITAPGYKQILSEKNLSDRRSDLAKYRFKMEQEMTTVNVTVLDFEGNPVSKAWLHHHYKMKNKWRKRSGKPRGPTDENGQFPKKWIYENGAEPKVEHFLSSRYLRKQKGFIAQIVKAMPGESVVLEMLPSVEVQGKIVDSEGNGIAHKYFNFYYIINGASVEGPSARSRKDGSYGPMKIAPGFDYELHISSNLLGNFGEGTSFFIDESKSLVEIPDCVFPR